MVSLVSRAQDFMIRERPERCRMTVPRAAIWNEIERGKGTLTGCFDRCIQRRWYRQQGQRRLEDSRPGRFDLSFSFMNRFERSWGQYDAGRFGPESE